jgi:hypothetical protein
MVAISSNNVAICWRCEIGSNNEFIRLVPDFSFADGGVCQGFDYSLNIRIRWY